MKNFKLFEIKSFLDQKRGTLFAYDKIFKNHKIKNAFVVSANKNFLRGGHAHKKASQFIVCLEGKIKISITSKLSTSIVILKESEKKIVFIKPHNWVEIKFLNKGKILVFSTEEYKKNEYINNFKYFQK